jgi:hypothetical protein
MTTTTSWTETAYDWIQRSKRTRALEEIPKDPSAAAWSFLRGNTGISFLDAALRRQLPDRCPVMDLRGDGKTWTIVSLAARFVAATRISQFATTQHNNDDPQPQVILLDSTLDVTVEKLAYCVRGTLLRQLESESVCDLFEEDMNDCLSRIHIATHTNDWVPLLETIRQQLAPFSSDHPTLILWDGFLQWDDDSEASRMEIIRQMARLIDECSVVVVLTTMSHRTFDWDRFVTHRIRLQKNESTSGHEYVATVQGAQIPFSITLSGILS